MNHVPLILAHAKPAGAAAAEDLIPATIVGLVLIVAVIGFGYLHRSGKTRLLLKGAGLAERVMKVPGWAALPSAIVGVSLIVAVFGFYADVASHIDNGRDPGPFANPFHFFIIAGLGGIALAGIVSILLGSEKTPSSVQIRPGWNAPAGGVLLLVCGGIAVLGFPLDDVWHRLFGQDVTLWSPTHMQMVGGASLSTLAFWILLVEGRRASGDRAETTTSIYEVLAAGAMLVGLSAFQAEFDYSVPQFRLLFHPVLLMLSAGITFAAARTRLGRGGAVKAALFFIALRGVLSLIVGPGLGHTTLHFPLYIVEALVVEVVALTVTTRRPVRFGVIAGLGIGTVGLAAEWGWSHVWMTMEWPASLLPEGVLFGVVAGVAGGVLGATIGRAFASPEPARERRSRVVGVVTGLAILFVLAYPFPTTETPKSSATVSLEPAGEGEAIATIALDPVEYADDAEWFNVTSWQGGGSRVVELESTGPGTFRTVDAVPVVGEWKTLIRLHTGSSIMALPIYLPEDPAIPAPGVAAEDSVTRTFILDKEVLLREAKDVNAGLTIGASSVMALIALVWAIVLGWGLIRLQSLKRDSRRPATNPA
jgi:hypothetical protein